MLTMSNKKAQLSLTNPPNAKACQKLLQFDGIVAHCMYFWAVYTLCLKNAPTLKRYSSEL